MKEGRMFEGMTIMYNYCLEQKFDEDAQIIEIFIKKWEGFDFRQREMAYTTIKTLMRKHSFPRRMPTQLDLDLDALRVIVDAASKAEWDIIGHLALRRQRSEGKNAYTLYENMQEYLDFRYTMMRQRIRKMVNDGIATFGRNDDGKLVLTVIQEEEE
tara:strand:+ start:31 stop:501 length:471 start_codon:yes stop_codon:yes gene_type:complete